MANSYFTHLECSSGCGAGPFDPRELHFLCPSCKLPILVFNLKTPGNIRRVVMGEAVGTMVTA